MIWNIEEYQGIFSINKGLVDHLNHYLGEKEAQLSAEIISCIPSLTPLLEPPPQLNFRFHEAVEEFGKKIHGLKQSDQEKTAREEWKISTERINQALWEYVEILEGCVIELFQQLDQISFDHWDADLSQSVTLIKDNLMHRIDDTLWGIKRLNHQLKDYRWFCLEGKEQWKFWLKPNFSRSHLIDRPLSLNLLKAHQFLEQRYGQFIEKYHGYIRLYDRCEIKLNKFYDYRVLLSLDLDSQDKLKKLDFYLNLWDYNHSAKTLSPYEPVWALRSSISPFSAIHLLHEYFEALKRAIYEKSRLVKKKFQVFFQDQEGKDLIATALANYRQELEKLRSMTVNYREFLEKTDRDFSEESLENKNLTSLINDILQLDSICERFRFSLEKGELPQFSISIDQAIQQHLHEMAQPLATRENMRVEAESLLKLLNELDELATYNPYIVDYVGNILLKATKADWKYHVLQGIPLFHQIYEMHKNIVDPIEDRQHTSRLNLFKRTIAELEGWVKSKDMLKHTQEIEADLSDLKGYLQDFFARVQRMGRDPVIEKEEVLTKILKANQQILEYRYLFGKFFHQFKQKNPEEWLLRKQLFFVDQYFESIENSLLEIKRAHKV